MRSSRTCVGDLEQQHVLEATAHGRQHAVERLGLHHGAGEAVEQEARLAVGPAQPLVDHAVDQLVGHQLAGVGVRLELLAQGAALADGGADDVTRRDLRDAELLDDGLGLRALASARQGPER